MRHNRRLAGIDVSHSMSEKRFAGQSKDGGSYQFGVGALVSRAASHPMRLWDFLYGRAQP
jgi:hypothetical protein